MESTLSVRHRRRALTDLTRSKSDRFLVTLYDCAIWRNIREGFVANALSNQLERIEHEGLGKVVCSNLLDDCIQILVEVESEDALEKYLDRFILLSSGWVEWKKDMSIYRLERSECLEDFAYYVFMGPYRRGLLDVDERNLFWRSWQPNGLFDFGETCGLSSFQGGSLRKLMWVESAVEHVSGAV